MPQLNGYIQSMQFYSRALSSNYYRLFKFLMRMSEFRKIKTTKRLFSFSCRRSTPIIHLIHFSCSTWKNQQQVNFFSLNIEYFFMKLFLSYKRIFFHQIPLFWMTGRSNCMEGEKNKFIFGKYFKMLYWDWKYVFLDIQLIMLRSIL